MYIEPESRDRFINHDTDSLQNYPALVLNADYRPLSYFPLSIWSWQDAVKAIFRDSVTIVSEYERIVSSPTMDMKLPSVLALKEFIPQSDTPVFTRFNVFLRDEWECQYCGDPNDGIYLSDSISTIAHYPIRNTNPYTRPAFCNMDTYPYRS